MNDGSTDMRPEDRNIRPDVPPSERRPEMIIPDVPPPDNPPDMGPTCASGNCEMEPNGLTPDNQVATNDLPFDVEFEGLIDTPIDMMGQPFPDTDAWLFTAMAGD